MRGVATRALEVALMIMLVMGVGISTGDAAVGDVVDQITAPVSGVETYCSVGLTFDGTHLYYDRCGDSAIYKIDTNGVLVDTFDTGIAEYPNALAYDDTRKGIWIGAQACTAAGMPIYFWDFGADSVPNTIDDSVTLEFTISFAEINPATGQSFLNICFTDGLAFNANDPADASDDELWFSDDVNLNVGVFRPDGTFVAGYDATVIDPSLGNFPASGCSGLEVGGPNLYMGNDGGGDVFRADIGSWTLVDQFTSGDERQEDMACDADTFDPVEVMWVRTTPQGGDFADVITAYEIEPGTCKPPVEPPCCPECPEWPECCTGEDPRDSIRNSLPDIRSLIRSRLGR